MDKTYSISLAVRAAGVSQRQLYYWEQLGIINPTYVRFGSYSYRRYNQQDIDLLIKLKRFLDAGLTLKAAAQRVRNDGDMNLDLEFKRG